MRSLAAGAALLLFLAGCVTTGGINPAPMRAASDYVTVYCGYGSGTGAYMFAVPAEHVRCQPGDTAIDEGEYRRRQPPGAQFQAFASRREGQMPPAPASGFQTADVEWNSSSRPGDGAVFTFRGMRIGDAWEDKFASVPNSCSNDVFGEMRCEDRFAQVGDVPINGLTYLYLDKRLYGFVMTFHTRELPRISDLLEARYGKAHEARVESVQNRMGAAFENQVRIWMTPHGPMKLEQRWATVDTSALTLIEPMSASALRDRQKGDAAAKAKSAF